MALLRPNKETFSTEDAVKSIQATAAKLHRTLISRPKPIPPAEKTDDISFKLTNNIFGGKICAAYSADGSILNNGRSVPTELCQTGSVHLSLAWAKNYLGGVICVGRSPDGKLLNNGRAIPDGLCRYADSIVPSDKKARIVQWMENLAGANVCAAYDANGKILNDGYPVPDRLCRHNGMTRPHFEWTKGYSDSGCVAHAHDGSVLDEGQIVPDSLCRYAVIADAAL